MYIVKLKDECFTSKYHRAKQWNCIMSYQRLEENPKNVKQFTVYNQSTNCISMKILMI